MRPTILITSLAYLLICIISVQSQLLTRQATALPIPSCAQTCVDGISSATSSCSAGDIPCRCLDSAVLQITVACVRDNCSGNELDDATIAVGSYCADQAVSDPPDFSDPSAMASYSSRAASLDSLLSTNTIRLGDDVPTTTSSPATTITSVNSTDTGIATDGPTAVPSTAAPNTSLRSGGPDGTSSGGGGSGAGHRVGVEGGFAVVLGLVGVLGGIVAGLV